MLSFPTFIVSGRSFIKALEAQGALAVYTPLEGGSEGRYLRRVRAAGYRAVSLTARGLGDPAMYLTGVHGIRPPHLGKKTVGNEACVGDVEYILPLLNYRVGELKPKEKGVVIWLIEGVILSSQELNYLIKLTQQDKRIKIVVEMGGARAFSWKPLHAAIAAA